MCCRGFYKRRRQGKNLILPACHLRTSLPLSMPLLLLLLLMLILLLLLLVWSILGLRKRGTSAARPHTRSRKPCTAIFPPPLVSRDHRPRHRLPESHEPGSLLPGC